MSATHLIYAMLSHRGRVRKGNEDTCAAAPEIGAFVVCDGMGGAAAGEVASNLAADTFLANLSSPPGGPETSLTPETRMNAAIQAANHAVYQQSRQQRQYNGMGTTLVALLHAPVVKSESKGENGKAATRRSPASHLNSRVTDPPTLWLGHVGDSRCYRQRRGKLEQLTIDHSLIEEQLRAGQITLDQAAHSPMRNLITRAIGSQATVQPEIQSHRPQANDVYLLASDGLTHEVTDEEIAEILTAIPRPQTVAALTKACEDLITTANRNGGNDNITVLLVAVAP
ncbi:protein phosphatase 2C domain-containing protein [Tunturiibacter empetritectus]|uniref:Protein phosphatase n=1 Tax=Tunturiibacter lichenicola TaxID=2051959 RepID=A0A852VAA3_9BACT|nr:protein phosphatase 2C domain-containing protein [Edaphobacter lichenicola]NYF88620.1 protein phosphatase [Edaphobacter lichenicola]